MGVPVSILRKLLLAEESGVAFRARVKELVYPEPSPTPPGLPQRVLWSVDAKGLPPRPWRILPSDVFDCVALGTCGMTASVCVARQLATDAQRTTQASRGKGADYPHCDTTTCAQGRGIREALRPNDQPKWIGAGLHARFSRGMSRDRTRSQVAARARLQRVGLLEDVRTMDEDERG